EMNRPVELVTVGEVRPDVVGPLVGLGQQDAAGVLRIDDTTELLENRVGLGQVLAARALALDEIRHRVAAKAVEPAIEPEPHDVEHGGLDGWVVVVEIGLVAEEAMPVVPLGQWIEGPVRLLRIPKNDSRLPVPA